MTTLRTVMVCLALLGGYGAAWRWVEHRLAANEEQFRLRRAESLAARRAERASHEAARERDQAAEDAAREAAWKAESARLLGGGVEAALRKPDTGIAAMIEDVCLAITRRAVRVVVRVDRFVEFLVTVELSGPASDLEMAGWSRDLLVHTARYVHSIRFLESGKVIGELDRRAIESATNDWSAAIPELTRHLRSEAEDSAAGRQITKDTQLSKGTTSTETVEPLGSNMDPEMARAIGVNRELTLAIQQSSRAFFEGLRDLNETVRRLEREGARGLVPARESVQRFVNELKGMRTFLADPAGELDRRLKESAADEVYRRAAVRTFRQDYPAGLDAERMIAQARRYSEVLLSFLSTMDKHRAGWMVLAEVQKIQFLDADLFEVYRQAVSACELEQKEMEKSVKAWQATLQRGKAEPAQP